MRIIQSFTKQDVVSFYRTLLNAMKSSTANKATSSTEEQIGVIWQKTRKSIECKAINHNIDGIRENGAFIERDPVGVMEVRHDLLTTQIPSTDPFLYTLKSVKEVSLLI
jgi:hypothetical protein